MTATKGHPAALLLALGVFPLVFFSRLWLAPTAGAGAAADGLCQLRRVDAGVEVELTLQPSEPVAFRWSRSQEERLTDFARRRGSLWEPLTPSLEGQGSELVIRFPAGVESTLRWTVRLPERWDSPLSGVAREGFWAVPARSLVPAPDPVLEDVELRVAGPSEGATTLLPTGVWDGRPVRVGLSGADWNGGVLVSGILQRREGVRVDRRTFTLWTARSAQGSPAGVEVPVARALAALGSVSEAIESHLVVVPGDWAPLPGARTAWGGTHVVSERDDVLGEALRLVVTQLLHELPAEASLWLLHGLRSAGAAAFDADPDRMAAWRLELWERYTSLRAWKDPVARRPTDGRAFIERAWAEVAAPLAVDHLLARSPLSLERSFRVLADLVRLPRTQHPDRLRGSMGMQAALFHEQHVETFRLMPAPRDLPWSARRSLSEATPREGDERFVFVLTGNQHGYMETCGCVLNQNGGAARRNEVLHELRAEHPQALVVDAGNFLPPPTDRKTRTRPAEVRTFCRTLELAPYDVVVGSPTDLGMLLEAETQPRRFTLISGNRSVPEGLSSWSGSAQLERNGRPVSIFGWSADSPEQVDSENWMVRELHERLEESDPFEELAGWSDALPEETLRVVAGQLSVALIDELVRRFPQLDVVISSRYHGMVPSGDDPELVHLYGQNEVVGRTLVLYATMGYYGLQVFEAGASLSAVGEREWRSLNERAIQLEAHIEDHGPTRALIDAHYESEFSAQDWDMAPLFPGHERGSAAPFVGSDSCATCHPAIHERFLRSKHARAYETLLAVRRQHVPDCVRCHVVGLGLPGGFSRADGAESPLKGVGCEQCHGPGGAHVASGSKDEIERRLPEPGCAACHDGEHSPRFAESRSAFLEEIRHW